MKKVLSAAAGVLSVLLVLAAGLIAWAYSTTDAALAKRYPERTLGIAQAAHSTSIELGRRIVEVRNGCVDCHGANLAGKKVVENAFVGALHAPNITPAKLRHWSDDEVATAIRYGVGRDGRPLVLMPSHEYQHLAREDIVAVVAYLRSVPPIEQASGPVRIGPGARVLYALGKLPTLLPAEMIDQSRGFADKPAETASVEFGRYLASSACAGCHGAEFRGGPIPGAPPDWAPAAPIRLGSDARWSRDGFAQTMRTGRSAIDGRALREPMPVAITAQMDDTELSALWMYLSSMR